jgi:hypothetical protein
MLRKMTRLAASFACAGLALLANAASADPAPAPGAWPPPEFIGRWTGQGKLGFKDGKFENVDCRVTYIVEEQTKVKQTVRCATSGAKVEVLSTITDSPEGLAGEWTETVYNLHGAIAGKLNDKGMHIEVKSDDLAANMELILINPTTQVVEIQFFSSTLLGLTLQLKKG